MQWRVAVVCSALAACGHGHGVDGTSDDGCTPSCGDGTVCRYDTCIPTPESCQSNAGCTGDQYCDTSSHECVPWGVGPGGTSDQSCALTASPGVFAPAVQCEWLGPPAGDPYAAHGRVLSTPLVAQLGDPTPSIVFTSYNGGDRFGASCLGGDPKATPRLYGVVRVIDGRTCAQRATLVPDDSEATMPGVRGAAALAIGDLGGDDATPEIVAARSSGGLVAFTRRAAGWQVLWQTSSTPADQLCNASGPSIHDLDDDGHAEVVFYGAVYNGQTGAPIDESLATSLDAIGLGYTPVVADVDGDGVPELITGKQLYSWDKANHRWAAKKSLPGADGLVAVADFGTFPVVGQDDRAHTDGIAEIAVVFNGVVRVFNLAGREVFSASFHGNDGTTPQGGPLTIADFDGDGRVEIGSAGTTAYHVFDPDCRPGLDGSAPVAATCASLATDGVLWTSPIKNRPGDLGASSAFDFDGDGRPEIAYGDRCFTRLYDGATGTVLYSRHRVACNLYENPVIADSDGDLRAELITTSSAMTDADCQPCTDPTAQNCTACPEIDSQFAGTQCIDDGDCSATAHCGRDSAGDATGRCRCSDDSDCGDGMACRDPSTGASPAGKVCLSARPPVIPSGVHVLADAADRWVGARTTWNQHAYSITNVDDNGTVPRTSQWLRNWTQPGLNSFRANAPIAASLSRADLTIRQTSVACTTQGATVGAEVCNRGNQLAVAGVPVAVYAATTPSRLRCQAETAAPLAPGACATVSCNWLGPSGAGAIVVDDDGAGGSTVRECREDNNTASITVSCP